MKKKGQPGESEKQEVKEKGFEGEWPSCQVLQNIRVRWGRGLPAGFGEMVVRMELM